MNRKQIFYDIGVQALKNVLHPVPNGYVCPICIGVFADIAALTLEHVPPNSIGGKDICLTCRKCNNTAGHSIDAAIHNEIRLQKFLKKGNGPEFAKLTIEGIDLNVEINYGDNGLDIKVLEKYNNPKIVSESQSRIRQSLSNQTTFNISKTLASKKRAADIGYLKSAYLAVFSKLGYRWIFSQPVEIVRQQIINPEENIIDVFRVATQSNLPGGNGIYLSNHPFEFIFVNFDKVGILLPSPSINKPYLYEWILEQKQKNTKINFSFNFWWPLPAKPEFILDKHV